MRDPGGNLVQSGGRLTGGTKCDFPCLRPDHNFIRVIMNLTGTRLPRKLGPVQAGGRAPGWADGASSDTGTLGDPKLSGSEARAGLRTQSPNRGSMAQ